MNAVLPIAKMSFFERWSHKKFFWLISVVALFMFSNIIIGYLVENEFLRKMFLSPSLSFQTWHFFIFVIVLFQAAGSVSQEFRNHTAIHTLAYPIHRWHWCLGKLLGVLFFYASLVGILFLLLLIRALYAQVNLGMDFFMGAFQTVVHASAIITIAFGLGMFWGSGATVFILVVAKIMQAIALSVATTGNVWSQLISKVLYYGLPCQMNVNLFEESFRFQALLEFFAVGLYAAVVLAVAMFLFEKRSLPIRPNQ
jgi:ABC-type transport system involved in multi-copper enzyme maturation permease subunit